MELIKPNVNSSFVWIITPELNCLPWDVHADTLLDGASIFYVCRCIDIVPLPRLMVFMADG